MTRSNRVRRSVMACANERTPCRFCGMPAAGGVPRNAARLFWLHHLTNASAVMDCFYVSGDSWDA